MPSSTRGVKTKGQRALGALIRFVHRLGETTMSNKKLLVLGLSLALLGMFNSVSVRADDEDDDENMTPAIAKKIVKAMDDAKTTLAAGIKVAEDSAKGKAVLAHGEMDKDKLVFGVYCLAGDKLMDVDVDGKTSKVVESKEAGKHDAKSAKDEDEDEDLTPADAQKCVQALDEAKTTLTTAIKTAEDSVKGKAVMAHCEIQVDKVVLGVYCLAGEKLMDIDVDAKTGKIVESREIGAKAEGK
jgi:uncharacterized membrane protein YkoI